MLKVQGLTKAFKTQLLSPAQVVLTDLSFDIQGQRTTGFVGVNGAGKTTALKCILGFIHPDQGQISFFDQGPLTSEMKSQIGYLPERPYYYDFLTALQFLKFHWDLTGGGAGFEQRAEIVLDRVNLPGVGKKALRSFSKGMLQRIGIAQALLREPKFLIFDEPMSGLDPDGRILIKEIIQDEKKRHTTIFFSSHLLGDMDELCDNLVVINQGKLVYQGALQDFSKGQGVEKSFRDIRQQLGVRQ
ncbi:MAG: ABC transporter ATP-binding protein [Bdellovibrio sp. CG10_big_fil_rev_8_21_14_0_10_47_8]|nr:MAG: ABC transporter ATP-binding protein [Bdellovibrio sp. CG10_big_fil_rev_8_21_14_0_10_47_8]